MASTERILDAARGEFAEHGFGGARLQDIAARAHLSHPTLLYHFGSKVARFARGCRNAVRGANPRRGLLRLSRGVIRCS